MRWETHTRERPTAATAAKALRSILPGRGGDTRCQDPSSTEIQLTFRNKWLKIVQRADTASNGNICVHRTTTELNSVALLVPLRSVQFSSERGGHRPCNGDRHNASVSERQTWVRPLEHGTVGRQTENTRRSVLPLCITRSPATCLQCSRGRVIIRTPVQHTPGTATDSAGATPELRCGRSVRTHVKVYRKTSHCQVQTSNDNAPATTTRPDPCNPSPGSG